MINALKNKIEKYDNILKKLKGDITEKDKKI